MTPTRHVSSSHHAPSAPLTPFLVLGARGASPLAPGAPKTRWLHSGTHSTDWSTA